jgi:hypothetical protein
VAKCCREGLVGYGGTGGNMAEVLGVH